MPRQIKVTKNQHLAFMNVLVEDALSAERESHLHEIYGELLYFQCRSFGSKKVFLSVAPQYELGFQDGDFEGDGDDNPVPPPGRIMRSMGDDPPTYYLPDESIAIFTDGAVSPPKEDTDEESVHEVWNPPTNWRRPDYIVFARFMDGTMVKTIKVLVLVELKMDPGCYTLTRDVQDRAKIRRSLVKVVAQVLLQAQYVFAEFPDQDSVHAIIGVGLYFMDFKVERAVLPPLSQGPLYKTKKGCSVRQARKFSEYATNMSLVNCILTANRKDYHPLFYQAWQRAREPYELLRKYPR